MSKQISVNETVTFSPTSLDQSNSSYASVSSVENGYTDSDSSTYAQFVLTTGNGAATYIYYNFDTSTIPSGATISSVACSAKAYVNSTSSRYIATREIQLYSGTSAKGSSSTISTSTNSITLTAGTWTLSELQNAKIRIYCTRGNKSTSSSSYYCRFYGATLTVTYEIAGTAYTITATSSVEGITVEPITQDVFQSNDATVIINTDTLEDIKVLDNEIDVTNLLTRVEQQPYTSQVPTSASVSSISSGSSYAQYAVGKSAEDPYSSTSNMYTSSGSTGYAEYSFDFSGIPTNATIESVEVRVYGHRESSTTDSTHVAEVSLYTDSTQKGTAQEFTSTSNYLMTISSPGSWTRSELLNAKLRFTVGYYGGLVCGITWVVNYSVSGGSYYYTYSLTNVTLDHVISVEQAGAYIPPEEDPEYTYHSVTISSINATTTPSLGTTRVIEGTNQDVIIVPDVASLTLALDNGVDISNNLVVTQLSPTFTINNISGANYQFVYNSSTEYYESNNQGVANSAALARVNLDLPCRCLVTFTYINYAEATYDYGLFGKVDTALSTSYEVSNDDPQLSCAGSSYNTSSTQTLSYEVEEGTHFIDIKYRKDTYTDNNNDSLKFKLVIEPLQSSGYYTYTLSNIQEKHSLIFIFGDVSYYFITSSITGGGRVFPDGQLVVLEGGNYSIEIVPNSVDLQVTLTDNGTNVTSSLSREEGVNKDGEAVVSYSYKLTNIAAAHTLIATAQSSSNLLIKINGTWEVVNAVYKKESGRWVEQDITTAFSTGINYKQNSL